MNPDTMLKHAMCARNDMRFYIKLANRKGSRAEYHRREAKRLLRRAKFWLDGIRIEREKREAQK